MQILTAKETAEFLRIEMSTLYTWVHNKKLPAIKLYGKLCFEYNDLKLLIEKSKK